MSRTTSWPDTRSDDAPAEAARQLALSLQAAMGERSVRAVESMTGVSRMTIRAALQGTAWIDTESLRKLELHLGPLWPPLEDRPAL